MVVSIPLTVFIVADFFFFTVVEMGVVAATWLAKLMVFLFGAALGDDGSWEEPGLLSFQADSEQDTGKKDTLPVWSP